MIQLTRTMALIALQLFIASAMDCSGKQTAMDMVQSSDLSGQTYVITGGDGGLGYETALALASAKATVILACRSTTKCPAAVARITQATGNPHVSVVPLDLSSFDSVRKCAAAIQEQTMRIDVLINNAGLLNSPKGLAVKTEDGFDRVFEVNFLGSYLFVQELLPLLRKSSARIISVSSIASQYACAWGNYLPGCTGINKLHDIATMTPRGLSLVGVSASNYGVTKYLEIFTTAELARREQNITAFSVHPGIVSTDMTGGVLWPVLHAWCLASDMQLPCPRTAAEGATTQTYVAVAPKEEVAGANGKYFISCHESTSVRDEYARGHGEDKALAYQSAIYDMASRLVNTKEVLMV